MNYFQNKNPDHTVEQFHKSSYRTNKILGNLPEPKNDNNFGRLVKDNPIHKLIDKWTESNSELDIWEYIGISKQDYILWVDDPVKYPLNI